MNPWDEDFQKKLDKHKASVDSLIVWAWVCGFAFGIAAGSALMAFVAR